MFHLHLFPPPLAKSSAEQLRKTTRPIGSAVRNRKPGGRSPHRPSSPPSSSSTSPHCLCLRLKIEPPQLFPPLANLLLYLSLPLLPVHLNLITDANGQPLPPPPHLINSPITLQWPPGTVYLVNSTPDPKHTLISYATGPICACVFYGLRVCFRLCVCGWEASRAPATTLFVQLSYITSSGAGVPSWAELSRGVAGLTGRTEWEQEKSDFLRGSLGKVQVKWG